VTNSGVKDLESKNVKRPGETSDGSSSGSAAFATSNQVAAENTSKDGTATESVS